MSKKNIVFMHKISGDIKFCRTKLEGQLLGDDWTQIQFIKNKKGEDVMRVNFGNFTMDISPNGTKEVVSDGYRNSK